MPAHPQLNLTVPFAYQELAGRVIHQAYGQPHIHGVLMVQLAKVPQSPRHRSADKEYTDLPAPLLQLESPFP